MTVHGYDREEKFTRQVEEKIVDAAVTAAKRTTPVEFRFRLGEESSVGKNSRLLLEDGTIYWTGGYQDAVRPTGPFDPELPVLLFQKPDGRPEAILFNHSTHTIGTHQGAVRSPSYYGLAAQALRPKRVERRSSFRGHPARRITSTSPRKRRPAHQSGRRRRPGESDSAAGSTVCEAAVTK